ncbi:hypothetical protein C0Z18_30605, partial [Trinickia dabaoshanensis]
ANDIESVRIKEIQHQNDMTRIGTAALWKATAAPRRRYFNSLLMVLNEPEASLHPDLMPALGRLIRQAARSTQIWVISHSSRLAAALDEDAQCNHLELEKTFSETALAGQGLLDRPAWRWVD